MRWFGLEIGAGATRLGPGSPGTGAIMASSRSLRCGPFAPLPQEATCDPEPGDSCLPKLGPVS
jgi:hypothetical protein